MNGLEKLEHEAFCDNVKIHNYYLGEGNLKGFYLNGNIALNTSINNSVEKACILAEELGHHYTTVGNIVDMTDPQNRKQERQARLWAYNKQIGLAGIIRAFKAGCQGIHEMAEYLEVTEEFLHEAIECYRNKYGVYTTLDNYIIYFIPNLTIGERI